MEVASGRNYVPFTMENTVYQGKFLRVTEEDIEGTNFERVYIHPCVIILAETAPGRLLFIRERRLGEDPPVRLKLVTGFLEEGYSFEENVNRELQEEVGLKAGRVEEIDRFFSSGLTVERRYYALARDLVPSRLPNPDGDAVLSTHEFGTDEILDMIFKGNYPTSATTAVLLKYCWRNKNHPGGTP
jgi:8-oxo-dGTP pyrophosphatase MutT (NUDIX family)